MLRWKLVSPAGMVVLVDPIVSFDNAIVFLDDPTAFLRNPILFLVNPMVFLDNPMAFLDAAMVYPDVPMAFLGQNQVRSSPCLETNRPNIFLDNVESLQIHTLSGLCGCYDGSLLGPQAWHFFLILLYSLFML